MILYGKEHRARAEALGLAYSEKVYAIADLPQSSNGIEAIDSSDTTLSIWGHGGSTSFCDLKDVELGLLIQNWKKRNSSLKKVELITCDAQHNAQPLSGFAERAAKYVARDYKDVTFFALPKGQYDDDRSILWANTGTKTFCYISAPSSTTFDHANQRLQALSSDQGKDLGLVANAMAKERALSSPNNFTVNGGTLKTVRSTLSQIRY